MVEAGNKLWYTELDTWNSQGTRGLLFKSIPLSLSEKRKNVGPEWNIKQKYWCHFMDCSVLKEALHKQRQTLVEVAIN